MTTTTVDNSAAARLARLQAQGRGNSTLATKLASDVSAAQPTQPTFTYINNPDGTPVNASTPIQTNTPAPTPAPTPAATTQVTQTAGAIVNTKGMNTSSAVVDNNDATTQNVGEMQSAIDTNEANAVAESNSQKNLTTELSAVDANQLETKTKNAEALQSEYKAIQEQQIAEKTKNEMDYQAELQRQKDEDVSAQKTLQESENAQNQAAAAEMKAKNDADEHEMQIQNDIALERSGIAFAKLGLSFSGAAINTATQIFNTGVYNLAKLRTGNAKNYADLQVKINATAFNHKQAINKIITDNSEAVFKSKERLREFIGSAQNNILNNKAQTQKSIQDAIDKFKAEKQTREDKMWSDMNKANDRLLSATKEFQKTIEYSQDTTKKKIDALVTNGQWTSLSPEQRIKMEKDAGLPAGTTQNTIVAKTTQMINDGMKAIVGKSIGVPPATLNKMHLEVQRMLKLNVPMNTAVAMAIEKYKNTIPQVNQIMNAEANKAKLAQDKADIENRLKMSQIEKNQATTQKTLRTSSGGGRSSGGSGVTSGNRIVKQFEIETQEPIKIAGYDTGLKKTVKKVVMGSVDKKGQAYITNEKGVEENVTGKVKIATAQNINTQPNNNGSGIQGNPY